MTDTIKLGYWKIRGRAHISRLLLVYAGAQWEDVIYTDLNQWFAKDKQNIGLDFPNLPYLIDGDLKISESSAIERYIAGKFQHSQLLGKTIHDSAKINEVVGVLGEIRQTIVYLFFDKEYESKLKPAWQKVKPKIEYLEKFLSNKEWALGYATLADFYIAEISNYIEKLYPEEYKTYAFLDRIRNQIQNLPQIKEYYNKEDSIKAPFFHPHFTVIKF